MNYKEIQRITKILFFEKQTSNNSLKTAQTIATDNLFLPRTNVPLIATLIHLLIFYI